MFENLGWPLKRHRGTYFRAEFHEVFWRITDEGKYMTFLQLCQPHQPEELELLEEEREIVRVKTAFSKENRLFAE